MNVEIGAEATLFQEKEYISGIFVAVYCNMCSAIWTYCEDVLSVDTAAEPAPPHLRARWAAASARLRERGGECEAHAPGHGADLSAAARAANICRAAG